MIDDSSKELIKNQQMLNRLANKLASEKHRDRKKETRRKIELGGLVVKAQLDHLPKSVILGALEGVRFEIENDPNALAFYEQKGEAAFEKIPEKNEKKV